MVSGHLAVKKNRWYAILCLRHPDGRRYDKWITTGLSYPGNKRKAEAIVHRIATRTFTGQKAFAKQPVPERKIHR